MLKYVKQLIKRLKKSIAPSSYEKFLRLVVKELEKHIITIKTLDSNLDIQEYLIDNNLTKGLCHYILKNFSYEHIKYHYRLLVLIDKYTHYRYPRMPTRFWYYHISTPLGKHEVIHRIQYRIDILKKEIDEL